MSLSNNDMILKDVMDSIKRSGEQLEAEKTITWEDLGDIQAKLVKILSQRLKIKNYQYLRLKTKIVIICLNANKKY
jgi:hypothetical protein